MTFIALMGLTCKLINPAILIWTIYCRLYLCKRVTDIGKEYFILYIQYGQKQMCNFKITVTVVLEQCRISSYCLHWWIKQCYYGTFTGESVFLYFQLIDTNAYHLKVKYIKTCRFGDFMFFCISFLNFLKMRLLKCSPSISVFIFIIYWSFPGWSVLY